MGYRRQQLEERVRALREFIAHDPEDALSQFSLGQALLELKCPGEALPHLERAVALKPDHSAAYRALGEAQLAAGEARAAAETFRSGIAIAEARGDLQTAHEMEVFLARTTSAAEATPAHTADSTESLAESTISRTESVAANAAHHGRPAVPVPPQRGKARNFYKRGFNHFIEDRLEEAAAQFRRAVDLDPELAIAWNALARALFHAGDLPGSIAAAQRLVELEPDDPLSHTNLSILYQQQGLIREAEEEKALALRLQMKHNAQA